MVLLKVILLVFCYKLTSAQLCPPLEDVYPCMCFGDDQYLRGRCSGLTSLDQLKIALNGFDGSSLYTFTIHQSDLDKLPYNIFENVSVQHLSISKSNLRYIGNLGEPQFAGLEASLRSLTISETFTEKQPFTYVSLNHLKVLVKLEMRKNFLKVVHNEWFKDGPTSLKELRFVGGHIQRVGWKAMRALINLKVVDLSDNAIEFIPRTALPQPALQLEELNLERNKLETLPEDIFSEMPNLVIVNLELNEFSTIDQNTWKPVWNQLASVNIDYNLLICDAKIKWIYEEGTNLERKLIAMCYKPFSLMERQLHTLSTAELY